MKTAAPSPCTPKRSRFVDVSSVCGFGLVAKRRFRPGELILPLTGRLAPVSYKTIQIDANSHLEGSVLAFINHSCRPSALIVTQDRAVRASTGLKIGEAVTFFYPSTEWEMVQPFECFCGGPDCIGYVAGARYLSAAILRRHFINQHIRQLGAQQYRSR
jgi:hypothetical protein